jgi:hypothetical protein
MDSSIDKQIELLEKELKRASRGAEFDDEAKKLAYRLTNQIEDLKEKKEQKQKEKDTYESYATTKKPSLSLRKSVQNPPIEILVNVFIDGKHVTPTPGEYLHFDKNFNLHKETKTVNSSDLSSLQYKYTHLGDYAREDSEFLKEQYLDEIAKAHLTFEPQFYLALSEIKGLLDLTEFTQEYEGEARSADRVEANIATLLRILFDKKEIEVNGRKCEIVEYSWEKNRFPPYGYQTSRIVPADISMVSGSSYVLDEYPFQVLKKVMDAKVEDYSDEISAVEDFIDEKIVLNEEALTGALTSYGTPVLDPKNISLNNHSNYLVYPDLYYSTLNATDRYRKFVYEYLAYRCSIYHSFFKNDVWTIYSQVPYFVNSQKNSELAERLLLYAPTKEIKTRVRELFKLWTGIDAKSYHRMTQIQYYTQLAYLNRMCFQIKHRLEFMQLALNCIMIQVILKEAIRCSKLPHKKDTSIQCLSEVAKATLSKFLKPTATIPSVSFASSFGCSDRADQTEENGLMQQIEERGYKINGTTADATPIENIRIHDVEDYGKEVEEWVDVLNEYKSRDHVRRYVSLNHQLPPTLECVFTHIQKLQLAMYAAEIQKLSATWTAEREQTAEICDGLSSLLKTGCVRAVLKLLQNTSCADSVESIYSDFKKYAAIFLKKADVTDDAPQFHMVDEKYDAWYAPLNELQAMQKKTMDKYTQCVRDLRVRLQEIQADDSVYGRCVNQLDYAVEAFEKIKKVNPVHTAIRSIPEHCVQITDYAKINRYLNILFDLMENKVLRGFVWGADFKYTPSCADPEAQHNLIQQILNKEGDLLTQFSNLDPQCVVQYAKFDLTDMLTARKLYEYSKELIRGGKFVLGIEAVNLALLFKFEAGPDDALYRNCRALLSVLWKSTGKKIAAERILQLEPGVYSRAQYWLYYGKWINSDRHIAERVKHLLYSNSIHFGSNTVKALLRIFPEIRVRSRDDDDVYLAAVTNYCCIQAAVSSETAETILSNLDLGQEQLEKVLKYFPHDHVVSNVVAQIAEAMRDSDYDDTFKFVAHYLMKHRKNRGRPSVDELKAANSGECGVVKIEKSLEELRKVDEKLEFAKEYIQNSAGEREDEWPNKLERAAEGLAAIPNFFKMAVRAKDYPYVDGNYKIRIVVDLILVTHEPTADPKTCEEKYAAARDLYYLLTKKEKES